MPDLARTSSGTCAPWRKGWTWWFPRGTGGWSRFTRCTGRASSRRGGHAAGRAVPRGLLLRPVRVRRVPSRRWSGSTRSVRFPEHQHPRGVLPLPRRGLLTRSVIALRSARAACPGTPGSLPEIPLPAHREMFCRSSSSCASRGWESAGCTAPSPWRRRAWGRSEPLRQRVDPCGELRVREDLLHQSPLGGPGRREDPRKERHLHRPLRPHRAARKKVIPPSGRARCSDTRG